MLLYIVRHAYAYEHGDPRWPDDSQRPLEKRGARRFERLVKRLAKRGFEPGLIATSPYVRCRQTADIVADRSRNAPPVVELAALEPGSDFDSLVEWTRQSAEAAPVVWVGHEPDVGKLTAALLGDNDAGIRFAKGAIAAIEIQGDPGYGSGTLQWLATAKILGV